MWVKKIYLFVSLLALSSLTCEAQSSYDINIAEYSKELVIDQPASTDISLFLDQSYPDLEKITIKPIDRSYSQDITIEGDLPKLKKIQMKASSGDLKLAIKAELPKLEKIEMLASSGDIELQIDDSLPSFAQVKIAATSGDITFKIRDGIAFELNTSSTSGSVSNKHSSLDTKSLNVFSRHKSYATPSYLGERFFVNISTTSGDISISN